jgi:hypothetical protein
VISFEKIEFARKKSRFPSRKSNLFERNRVRFRDNGICSKEIAFFFEKIAFALNLLQPVGFLAGVIAPPAIQSMQFGQPVELCAAQA